MATKEEGVYEGGHRGKPCYFVFFDRGNIEITFYKGDLKYAQAYSYHNDPGEEFYNSRELKQFRADYPGYYEAALMMLTKYLDGAAKAPARKKSPAKKTPAKRRS